MMWHKVIGAGGAGGEPEGSWDLTTLSYTGNSWYVSSPTTPGGITFKPDGTRLYYCGSSDDFLRSIEVPTPWDISSAAGYVSTLDFSGYLRELEGLFIKSDGQYLYVANGGRNEILQLGLTTPWDITTGYLASTLTLPNSRPMGVFLSPDGSKLYALDVSADLVFEYNASFFIGSSSYVQSFSVASQDTFPTGISFKPDGTRMYIVGGSNDAIYQYDLSTAWDISTASYTSTVSISSQDTSPRDIYMRSDGLKLYMYGNSTDSVYEYDMT